MSQPLAGVIGSWRWTTSKSPSSIARRVSTIPEGKSGMFETAPFALTPKVRPTGTR